MCARCASITHFGADDEDSSDQMNSEASAEQSDIGDDLRHGYLTYFLTPFLETSENPRAVAFSLVSFKFNVLAIECYRHPELKVGSMMRGLLSFLHRTLFSPL